MKPSMRRTLTTIGFSLFLLIGITLAWSCHASNATSRELSAASMESKAEVRVAAQLQEVESTKKHMPYLHGSGGFFYPDQRITRAQSVQLLCNLGVVQPGERKFHDVADTAWYAPAVYQVSGLLTGYADGTFRPQQGMTLAEFVTVLCRALDLEEMALNQYADEDASWYAPYWSVATEYQWFPPGSNFQGNSPLSRAVAVTICNRALGRIPDKAYLSTLDQAFFVDVQPDHWAYYEILEAAIGHTHATDGSWETDSVSLPSLTSGIYTSGGVGYYVTPDGTLYRTPGILKFGGNSYLVADDTGRIWADGAIHPYHNTLVCCAANGALLKNASFRGFRFDEQGFYTSGSEEIDGYVADILAQVTTSSMTQKEKLRAVFNHVRAYRYLGRNATITNAVMTSEQSTAYAAKLFSTGKGDCYNFTAAFHYLARALGYDSTAIVGTCYYSWNSRPIAHAWVEIPINGKVYLFDPQIENYNLRNGISNTAYGAFQVTYATAHAVYYPN